MFIRLLVLSILSIVVVQSAVTNSSKGHKADALTLQKQNSLYDDYDLNDQKLLGSNGEGSGGSASLDEYADDEEEEEELAKVTATTAISTTNRTTTTITTKTTTTTTTTSTTTTSLPSTTRRTTSTTMTTSANRWSKSSFNYESFKRKNQNTTTLSPAFSDIDASEFKDDHDEYADDLEDDAYYNEPTISEKIPPTAFSTVRYPSLTTRHILPVNHTTPIWMLFTFLTRPPIAAGILAGLAIGIFTSLILLICIIQRYNKRDKSHSSYTTGLLYPNQYGYSKSPQEFYA